MTFLPFWKCFRGCAGLYWFWEVGGQRALLARAAMFLGYNTGSRTPRTGVQGQPMAMGGL